MLMQFNSYTVSGGAKASDTLAANHALQPGQSLNSANGQFRAIYQGDGNFVVYFGNRALWSSRTNGKPSNRLIMQGDGNLVIYRSNFPVWATMTNGKGGNHLVMQNDGNLVIYAGSRPVWATNTVTKVVFVPPTTKTINFGLGPNLSTSLLANVTPLTSSAPLVGSSGAGFTMPIGNNLMGNSGSG